MPKVWTDDAQDVYIWWQQHDKKTLKRLDQLIRDVERDPFDGIGKPESLRGELSGMWLRRINQEDRLVYEVADGQLIIYSAKDHYAWAPFRGGDKDVQLIDFRSTAEGR